MSAFVVGDFHINCLVGWAFARSSVCPVSYMWRGQRMYWRGNEERIAQVLYAENVRSVSFRYPGKVLTEGHRYRLESYGGQMTPIQVIRAAHCLEYQSCECEDWQDTEACAMLVGLVEAAVRALPGYEQAAWELLEKQYV